jgi:hypothetical protein
MMALGFIAEAHALAWLDAHKRTRPWLKIGALARRAIARERRREFARLYAARIAAEEE